MTRQDPELLKLIRDVGSLLKQKESVQKALKDGQEYMAKLKAGPLDGRVIDPTEGDRKGQK